MRILRWVRDRWYWMRWFSLVILFLAAPAFGQDTAKQFAKDLRAFLAARASHDPAKAKLFTFHKEQRSANYGLETMKLYRSAFRDRCVALAKPDKGLMRSCSTVHRPQHLAHLADQLEAKP